MTEKTYGPGPPDDESPKPPIADMPPEDGVPAPSEADEADVPEEDFMSPEEAAGDDTVDDTENDEQEA